MVLPDVALKKLRFAHRTHFLVALCHKVVRIYKDYFLKKY